MQKHQLQGQQDFTSLIMFLEARKLFILLNGHKSFIELIGNNRITLKHSLYNQLRSLYLLPQHFVTLNFDLMKSTKEQSDH